MYLVLLAQNDVLSTVRNLWDEIATFLAQKGLALGLNLLAALLIFLVGRWAAKIARALLRKVMARGKVDETLSMFLSNLAYWGLVTFVAVAAINRLGVDTTSFAAVVAAAGLAIGLALQGSLGNFAAGVLLILFQPFKVGDFVNAGGTSGVIEEIRIFNTRMRTGDNVAIIMPNNAITSATITNYSAKKTRRIDLTVGCGYEDDLKAVKAFLVELVEGDERIMSDPEPLVAVEELGESSVNFVVRPWVSADEYWPVRRELVEKIKLGFDERGFNIPYPTQDIHVHGAA